MKSRFSTLDIKAALKEVQENLVDHYVLNIYDIDSKTYLIKLRNKDSKKILLLESGGRIHPTEMEWPKSAAPSGFSMKLRKHLKGKRLTNARQLGFDRIIELQFGYSGCADEYHLIIELYDRGNIILCDKEYEILNLLRARTDKTTDERFAVREKYPVDGVKELTPHFSDSDKLMEMLENLPDEKPQGKKKSKKMTITKILNNHLGYGADILEHFLIDAMLDPNAPTIEEEDAEDAHEAIIECYNFLRSPEQTFSGFVTKRITNCVTELVDYQPLKLKQFEREECLEFPLFSTAIDHYYSQLQTQKTEQRMIQAEKQALKKLENVKLDHLKRLENLKTSQETNVTKAQLIEMNLELVEAALNQVRSALASQIAWTEIEELLTEAQEENDPVACAIRELKLKTNQIVVFLAEPDWGDEDSDESGSDISDGEVTNRKASRVTLDLGLSAFSNAKFYYDTKKAASGKETKTIDASKKALKNAEKKTIESLKNIEVVRQVTKVRKQLWFEKFLWFISSENYLIIAGRDAQQNEIIVKRHLRPGDAYIHADIHGASSCVVKNPFPSEPISPVTLHEVGHAAVCHSAAWDAKVVTSAWWVHSNQVSKTAPSGEYLTTGSFMIRGKKNYLPPSPLVMGFAFLFKLDESCAAGHAGERKIKGQLNDIIEDMDSKIEFQQNEEKIESEESDSSDSDSDEDNKFPDTKVDINYKQSAELPDEEVIYMGDDKPVIVKFKQPSNNPDHIGRQKYLDSKKNPRGKPQWAIEKEEEKQADRKKRGKASKQKKIKGKYGEMDEEELAAGLVFLGSAGNSEKSGTKKFQKSGRENSKRSDRKKKTEKVPKNKKTNVFQRADEQLAPPTEFDESEEKKIEPKLDADGNLIEQVQPQVDSEDEEDEIAKLLEEEGFMTDGNFLDTLTGKPLDDDVVHFAVPVIAPFASVMSYKYNLKMVPGNGKKGKTAKSAMAIFSNQKDAIPHHIDLMKVSKDEELTRNMPGKVKLAGAKANLLPKPQKKKPM